MNKFLQTYHISHLFISGTDTKEIAKFEINGLAYQMCLRGYSKEEQQEIEFNNNILMWLDDEFEKFFLSFFEEYRTYLQKYISMDRFDYKNYVFVYEIERATTLIRDVEITDYRKRLRTADKMCPLK